MRYALCSKKRNASNEFLLRALKIRRGSAGRSGAAAAVRRGAVAPPSGRGAECSGGPAAVRRWELRAWSGVRYAEREGFNVF